MKLLDFDGKGGATAVFSDIRMKENIKYKYTINGHKIYSWDWKDKTKNEPTTGVIAQEVQEYMPEAVSETEDGFLMVDYSMLGDLGDLNV